MAEKTETPKVPMRSVGWIVLFLVVALWLAAPAAARAGEVDCMGCHSGSPIDPEQYARSVHKNLPCTECHQKGFDKDPHTGKAAEAPSCLDCHGGSAAWDEAAQGVKASVHVEMVDKDFRCTNCHEPHYFLPARLMPESKEGFAAYNQPCLKCHAAGDTPADKKTALEELGKKHVRFPHEMTHLQRVACVACHTPSAEKSVHHVLPKAQAIGDCIKCHSQESLLAGKFDAFLAKKERAEKGWLNAALYNTAYMTGATRNRWLDWGTFALLAMVLIGIGLHALLRWFFGYIRRTS